LHRFFNLIGWKGYRMFFGEVVSRAGIAFGEPILVSDLPKDYKGAMDVVFERICKLSGEIHQTLGVEEVIPAPETLNS